MHIWRDLQPLPWFVSLEAEPWAAGRKSLGRRRWPGWQRKTWVMIPSCPKWGGPSTGTYNHGTSRLPSFGSAYLSDLPCSVGEAWAAVGHRQVTPTVRLPRWPNHPQVWCPLCRSGPGRGWVGCWRLCLKGGLWGCQQKCCSWCNCSCRCRSRTRKRLGPRREKMMLSVVGRAVLKTGGNLRGSSFL